MKNTLQNILFEQMFDAFYLNKMKKSTNFHDLKSQKVSQANTFKRQKNLHNICSYQGSFKNCNTLRRDRDLKNIKFIISPQKKNRSGLVPHTFLTFGLGGAAGFAAAAAVPLQLPPAAAAAAWDLVPPLLKLLLKLLLGLRNTIEEEEEEGLPGPWSRSERACWEVTDELVTEELVTEELVTDEEPTCLTGESKGIQLSRDFFDEELSADSRESVPFCWDVLAPPLWETELPPLW